jgi:hypothetical protein
VRQKTLIISGAEEVGRLPLERSFLGLTRLYKSSYLGYIGGRISLHLEARI